MPERDNIKIISNTIITERVSENKPEAVSGNGNSQPPHFGMVFFQNEKAGYLFRISI
jgi:hypothetical protein